jgi:hypothetical protein
MILPPNEHLFASSRSLCREVAGIETMATPDVLEEHVLGLSDRFQRASRMTAMRVQFVSKMTQDHATQHKVLETSIFTAEAHSDLIWA